MKELFSSFGQEQPIPIISELEKTKEAEFQIHLENERKETRERFGDLIELVNRRYEAGSLSSQEITEYKQHNSDILDYAIELGLKKEFNKEEIKILSMAAILHDLTKADQAPPEFSNIKNYSLVIHGQKAAEESREILSDDYLENSGFTNSDSQNFEKIRDQAAQAIIQHMGPHPGFMTMILEGVNRALEKENKSLIKHPPAEGKISETLLAADMISLASANGRKKVLNIRAYNDFFLALDKQAVEKYKNKGINFRAGEAALLSGFESADQAIQMIKDQGDKNFIKKLFEDSKKIKYRYNSDLLEVEFQESWQKKEKFEMAETPLN
ncbi:HD domain-containing protein [Candidatus Wolfebacteria bacterium]|nr:HD domain-containing protein [Candidatus Wolfebacteria bacterium]